MSRQTLIVGNWKMNKTVGEACELVRALLAHPTMFSHEARVVVAPPFTALAAVAPELGDQSRLGLCAQSMHWAEHGPYTGEISATMLVDAGCRYVLLGHSERRAACGETDEAVNLKVKSALAHRLTPIVAVGESFDEHQAGEAKQRVTAQVRAGLADLSADELRKCVVAYEPIWAIGSGLAEDPKSADEVMATIRSCYPALGDVQILYGGSVKASNVAALMAQPNIDGALVGGASLNAETFAELVINARKTAVAK